MSDWPTEYFIQRTFQVNVTTEPPSLPTNPFGSVFGIAISVWIGFNIILLVIQFLFLKVGL